MWEVFARTQQHAFVTAFLLPAPQPSLHFHNGSGFGLGALATQLESLTRPSQLSCYLLLGCEAGLVLVDNCWKPARVETVQDRKQTLEGFIQRTTKKLAIA